MPKERSHTVQNGNTGLKFGSSLKGSFVGLPFFARSTVGQPNDVTFQRRGFNAQSNAYLKIAQSSEWQYWPQIWIITRGSSFGLPFSCGPLSVVTFQRRGFNAQSNAWDSSWIDISFAKLVEMVVRTYLVKMRSVHSYQYCL